MSKDGAAPHQLFRLLERSNPPCSKHMRRRPIEVDEATGSVRLAYHAPPEWANVRGDVQGGFVASMLDSCCGCAVIAAMPRGHSLSTIEMKISYLHPTPLGELVGLGQLIKMGSSIAFAEGELWTPDGTRLLAKASTSVKLLHSPKVASQ